LSDDAIQHRLTHGRLRSLHRGVYVVGHSNLTWKGRWMAAVLAAGRDAVLSHRAAATLLELHRSRYVEVTLERPRRQFRGVRVHQLPLPPDEVTTISGIPVTGLSRTLFDLAAVVRSDVFERALHEAELQGRSDRLSLPDLLDRYPRRHGAKVVTEVLARGATLTRSELESRFRSFLLDAGVPEPEFNAWLLVNGRWIECDCVWREGRAIIELDGRATHGTAAAFERDRVRDRELTALGWRLARVTWRQLRDDPEALAYDLRAILSSDAGTAPSRSTSQVPSRS
jgi:hypothetical protein